MTNIDVKKMLIYLFPHVHESSQRGGLRRCDVCHYLDEKDHFVNSQTVRQEGVKNYLSFHRLFSFEQLSQLHA